METTNQFASTIDYSHAGLVAQYLNTVEAIHAYAKSHDLQLNGLEGESGLLALSGKIANVFQLMSQNARKKSARRMRRFKFRATMQNANKLLAYLHKHAKADLPGYAGSKPELRVGKTEHAVQAMHKAHQEYAAAKGDFYKNQAK
jgi:hypothetical protein